MIYLLGVAWLTAATLLRLTPSAPRHGWPLDLRYAGRISAQALPVALVLWLFFPRFDAPLWHLPSERGSAQSGLSDTMSPGDIVDLALSDEIAFRVRFDGAAPPARNVTGADRFCTTPTGAPGAAIGPAPRRRHARRPRVRRTRIPRAWSRPAFNWLFALDWPDRWNVPDARLNSDDTLLEQPRRSRGPIDVTARSHTHVHTQRSR